VRRRGLGLGLGLRRRLGLGVTPSDIASGTSEPRDGWNPSDVRGERDTRDVRGERDTRDVRDGDFLLLGAVHVSLHFPITPPPRHFSYMSRNWQRLGTAYAAHNPRAHAATGTLGLLDKMMRDLIAGKPPLGDVPPPTQKSCRVVALWAALEAAPTIPVTEFDGCSSWTQLAARWRFVAGDAQWTDGFVIDGGLCR
jgi:hypothetical protein